MTDPVHQKLTCPLALRRLGAAALIGSVMTSAQAAGDWASTLQARDINGDGTVDAYYDTSLNVTWLAVVNASAGSAGDLVWTNDTTAYVSTDPSVPIRSGLAVPYTYVGPGSSFTKYAYGDGLMTQVKASNWASTLDVHGVTGWRLPSATDVGSPGCVAGELDCGSNLDLTQSELAHLFYVTLGNHASEQYATVQPDLGPFKRNNLHLSAGADLRSYVFFTNQVGFAFNTLNGYQIAGDSGSELAAWAVRSGDVPSVPESGTFSLMAVGLFSLIMTRRFRSC